MQYIVHWDLALHRDLTSLKLIGQKKDQHAIPVLECFITYNWSLRNRIEKHLHVHYTVKNAIK